MRGRQNVLRSRWIVAVAEHLKEKHGLAYRLNLAYTVAIALRNDAPLTMSICSDGMNSILCYISTYISTQ